jgi:hypothetical protein
LKLIWVLLLLSSIAGLANASVKGYGIYHIRNAVQTGPTTLSNETAWLSAWINTTVSTDVGSALLTTPSGTSYTMSADGDPGVAYGSSAMTWSELDSHFPAGRYSFKVETGNLKGQTASVATTSPLIYPSRQPALSSASYNALANLNVGDSVSLNWGTWSVASPMAGATTFFTIKDLSTGEVVVNSHGSAATYTGENVTKNKFKVGHVYKFDLKFDAYYDQQTGFGGATASADTATETTGTFGVGVEKLELSPAIVLGGDDGVGTITLNGPAPASLTIDLSSSSQSVSVPASVTIPKGSTSATFNIETQEVKTLVTVTVTASINGAQVSDSFRIRPVGVESVTFSPDSVVGGNTVTCTVNLEGAALADITISFTSNLTSAVPTPKSLTVSPGQKSATFTLSTNAVSTKVVVTVGATANGVGKGAKLTVKA